MIRRLEKPDDSFTRLCGNDVFGTRIDAYLHTYGTDCAFASFYIQSIDKTPCAALCLIEDTVTLCCDNGTDYRELSAFLNALCFRHLLADARVIKDLELVPSKSSYTVRFRTPKKSGLNRPVTTCGVYELADIYDILNRADFSGLPARAAWLCDVSSRVKTGTAAAAIITEDGQKAACAMALFMTEKAALIGAVATLPAFRGRGLAGHLVTTLALQMIAAGKRAELLCANDSLLAFYEELGFESVGFWAQYDTPQG